MIKQNYQDMSILCPIESLVDREYQYFEDLSTSLQERVHSIEPSKQDFDEEKKHLSNLNFFQDPFYKKYNGIKKPQVNIQSFSENQYTLEKNQNILKQQKTIIEQKNQSDIFDQNQSKKSIAKQKKVNKTKLIKRPYPTKNMLPVFRSPFLNYLQPHFEKQQFEKMQIVKRIRGKSCISMDDYNDLFNVEQFRPFLETYFKNKNIYRDLLQSRVAYNLKIEYLYRIEAFEQAFKKKKFVRIN